MFSKLPLPPLRLHSLSLMFVCLMWVVPFLYYYHAYPLTTFYQEWGAALLGCCALPLLLSSKYWQQPEIPRIALLPLGLLILGLLQFMLGRITYFDQALLLTFYLLWCALLIMLGQRLREEFGLPALAALLAGSLLLGAELGALIGILQHFHWHSFLDSVIVVKTSAAISGNVAQPNHYANYIALGLASLGLLFCRRRLHVWQVVLLATPLLFVLTLSGSRSSWLYLIALAAIAFVWQHRDIAARPLLHYTLALIPGFALMHLIVQIPFMADATGSITTAARLFGEADSGSIRLYLWREAWQIFTQFPILGAGFSQFSYQHFLLGPALQHTNINGLYNNAHNIVMQLAAEMGVAGVLILLGALATWMAQAYRAPRTLEHWWGYAVLAILGIHSLLEYPLWYAYFVGIAAITLGMFDSTVYRLELRAGARLFVATMWLLGVFSLAQMYSGYQKLENLLAMRPASPTDTQYLPSLINGLTRVHDQALLRPYAELFMSGLMDLNTDNLPAKRALNEAVLHFIPASQVAYRQVWLLAMADQPDAARLQIERAIWSYPADFAAANITLTELVKKDAGRFAPLQAYALQKYQEWQRAALAK